MPMTLQRWALLACVLLYCTHLWSQNDVQTSMYWATPTLYNPATAGSDSALHVTAFDRLQWVGFDDAPQTFFVSADMPFKFKGRRTGVGVSVLNDHAGLFSTTYLSAQANLSLNLWGGRLALGLQPGFVNQAFKGGGISIPTGAIWGSADKTLPTADESGMAFDLALGAFFEHGWWYGGVGLQHLTGAQLELGNYAYTELTQTFYFHAGGNIPLKRTLFLLQPSVLVKTTFQLTQVDYTLRTTWNDKFWGGLTYRHGDAIVVMVGATIGGISLGYSYDVGISPLARESNGSHELLLGWTMHIDLDKKTRHGHKSIRIL